MERIHVTVRARPLSLEDAKTSPWRISGNSISITNHSSKFEFDQIFREDCKTIEVYQARTKDIVAAAVRGFNGTVFAYGQTNSGKTYTMRGSAIEPGVIPLAVHDLFDTIHEDADREFLLRMSYMEIYNEEINDLLAPEHRKLQIHESIERGIYVAGLREEIVASPEHVLDLMEFGESHRRIGETNMNIHSSRSHTIFRMIIESRDKTEDEDIDNSCDAVRVSVLNLVDLAGSERAAKTGAEGVRLKEGSHINKSLMTLGTVIKKLSEGAESQGGHVPYRDSKLTRILQPALGGNANTAIICNITLAQILTDAALLKRQKKEIEELRAKLQGSNSEHFEEEILNLRNTLLQTELERERIALELEEEKKAQAERERRLQEQAKKIENLSSMVLYSNRDENRDHYKKDKRRDTWCPGKLLRETLREEDHTALPKASVQVKHKRDMGPLLNFDELLNEKEVDVDNSFKQEQECSSNTTVDICNLPDPRALLHVTSRRKVPIRKKSLVENDELVKMQEEYEDLLLTFENQRIISEIQIDCLSRKLAQVNLFFEEKNNDCATHQLDKLTIHGDRSTSSRDTEAIFIIRQLQEQIKMLEMEKVSSETNRDDIVDLAQQQNICARDKYEELYEDFLKAKEEARVAHEHLHARESVGAIDEANFDSVIKLLMEVEEIMLEVQNSRNFVDSLSSVVDEIFESFSATLSLFLDLKSLMSQNSLQLKSIFSDHDKLHLCMQDKVAQLENEKLLLHIQSVDLSKQIEELRVDAQNFEQAMAELSEQHDLERSELFSHIQMLEKEISCLSSSSLAKEKENLRKDLEKTKVKLKETESKLKNAIQEKTKLEGEKAYAEREVKQLQSQKTLLERDISKRDSLAGRRRDSFIDRSSRGFEPKRAKGQSIPFEQTVQGENKKLEVLTFEMEATIASLEEDLAVAQEEKEEAMSRNAILASELDALSDKLNMSSSELNSLQEEVSGLRLSLEDSESKHQEMVSSINLLVEEKEELAMQLTDALLQMEEEKTIWSAKEKASVEAIAEKAKSFNTEMSLSKELLELREELESGREECRVLEERLASCEEKAASEKNCSMEKSSEIDVLKNELQIVDVESKRSQENLKNQLFAMTKERDKMATQIEEQQKHVIDVQILTRSYNEQLLNAKVQLEELTERHSGLETKMHNVEVSNSKEKAKLRMRLHWTQAKLDTFRGRHKEATDELNFMHKKYEEAAGKLKDKLASYGIEVLNLKKQLAAAKGQ